MKFPTTAAAIVAASAVIVGGCSRLSPESSTVTFNKEIAPIVFAECAPCHRPGEAAPFPLLSYNDVVKHARTIQAVTARRYMPPWLPEPGAYPVIGDRRLSDQQIDLIRRWVDEGMQEGDSSDLPPAPTWTDGWQLGKPDLVLTPERPYVLEPGTDDKYRDLVVRTSLESDVFVRAVEFRTGGAPVHHAVIRVDRTSSSRRRDGQDGQPGLDSMPWQSVQDPEGQFIGWAPGTGPILSPEGMSWRLDRGSDLVVEVHMVRSGKAIEVQPTIALFLTDKPPVKFPVRVRMGSKLIDIPAGERAYVVTDTYTLPAEVDLMSVFPHAHYLGKEMLFTAAFPDGAVKSLLHIKQWNFRWQQDYRYETPITLPAGTTLTMRYTYDNSDENVENPSHPPVRVRTGSRSTDEMATLGLQIMPKTAEDGARLTQAFQQREQLDEVARVESLVREEPNSGSYRSLLGSSLAEMGRFQDAIPHLEAAIRLGEKSAGTYTAMGMSLMGVNRVREALSPLERAAMLDPRNEVAYFNLGNALGALARTSEAQRAYEQSLEINPDFSYSHVNLAILLVSGGRVAEALQHFDRAVLLEPDSTIIRLNYGNALAGAGRFVEAMPHIKRALELDPGNPPALDTYRRLQRMGIQ